MLSSCCSSLRSGGAGVCFSEFRRAPQQRAARGFDRLQEFPMILTEVSAPPSAAVPVRAFAEHLRLGSGFADDGSQDAVLELYLRAAMAAIEARLGRALLARDFAWTVTHWREDASQGLPVGAGAGGGVGDAGRRPTAARRWSIPRPGRCCATASGRGWSGGSGAACRGSRGRGMRRSASRPGSARAGTRCRPTCGRRCSCWRRITTRTGPRAGSGAGVDAVRRCWC